MVGAVQPLRHWRQHAQAVQGRPAILHSQAWRVAEGTVRMQVAWREQEQHGGVRVRKGGGRGWIGGRRVPGAVWAVTAVLLGYAVLIRANGVFAVAPLVATTA